ncbi:hypothetical protein IAR55_003849 [Kwoniella newhampshirensis]|uniref:Aldehyde dehydrogenase domain-containing protein n=1 Tax=Kwoniella newhampshirensis TaxID=1651941 RepID=A0AAW0YPE1_9TREE
MALRSVPVQRRTAHASVSFSSVTIRRHTSSSSTRLPLVPLWIAGGPVTSSSRTTVITRHSKTRKDSCEVVVAGEEETIRAIRESRKAFQTWRDVSGWERRKILGKVLSLLQDRFPEFTTALRADGAWSDLIVHADQASAVNLTDGAVQTAISVEGTIPQTIDGSLTMVTREPYGPVLSIPAFNFPLTLTLRSIVYPLACGNTVIMKSSPLIPQLSSLFGPLLGEAGLPPGVLQILNFSEEDVAERVEQIIADDDVRMVNFTGSIKLGRLLAEKCGKYLKPSVMELGGKSPAIVLPSADLELAANNILFGAFANSGQVCMSTERVIVHEDVAEQFEKVLKETAEKARWTGGMELVRLGAAKGAQSLVDDAVKAGARIVYTASSSDSSSSSTSYPPTIIKALPSAATLSNTESFSPILTIHTAPTVPSIISLANSHETGLTSSIFSKDLSQALEVAKQLDLGAVHVNGMTIHDQHGLPHGGWKSSGWGRFNGQGAVESFTQTKNIRICGGGGGRLPLEMLYNGS